MTELEHKAAEAWAMMTRLDTPLTRIVGTGPMPVGLAIDYVQDVCGDRDDAVAALLRAGADWLDTQSQPSEGGEVGDACTTDARMIVLHLRSESLGNARVYLDHIRIECERAFHPLASSLDRKASHGWFLWLNKARYVLEWCDAVIAAAHPTPA